MLRKLLLLGSALGLLIPAQLHAQGAALVSGNPTTGHCAQWTNPNLLSDSGGACGGGSSGVSSFNTRTGAVTLSSSDVTTALTYTPLVPTNNLSDLASPATARTNLGTASGSPTTGHCAQWASTTTLSDAGSACGSGGSGTIVLLNTLTASSSASLSDTTSLTSAYRAYMLVLENLRPATNGASPIILFSTNGGSSYLSSGYSNYGPATTASCTTWDGLVVGVQFTQSSINAGLNGQLLLTIPPTPFAFSNVLGGTVTGFDNTLGTISSPVWGCANSTTSTVNAIQFQYSSGNIASGVLKIYGVP